MRAGRPGPRRGEGREGGLVCHCLSSRTRYRYAGPVRDRSARLSVLLVPSSPSFPQAGREGDREHARIDAAEELAVKEILRTNDAVLVSAVEALLNAAYIPHPALDQHMSLLSGSPVILPPPVLATVAALKHAR